jgi:hypothetical protein
MTRVITTLVVIAVLIGIVLAYAGVLRFQNTENQSTIILDKKELKEKAHGAVERTGEVGGEILDKTGQTLHKAAEGIRPSTDRPTEPAAKPSSEREGTRPTDANHSTKDANKGPDSQR